MSKRQHQAINKQRRQLLRGLAAAPVATLLAGLPGLSFASNAAAGNGRFVLIILRGAMDGVAAVTPYGDHALQALRAPLLPATDELHKLDSFFGLHPAFNNLAEMYEERELLVCHAVASPYRERSHFDGQNVLEIGFTAPDQSASGWLNRCVPMLGSGPGSSVMAIGQAVPPVLQGDVSVGSWAPAILPEPSAGTMQRLQALYADDEFLAPQLEQAIMAKELVGEQSMNSARGRQRNLNVMVNAAAKFLVQEDGPTVAVLESDGWDTHANQGASRGQLANKFTELDNGLAQLKRGLGGRWSETVVAVVTEFGRTVAVNGTQGTDHGTASAAFLAGGAVIGGRVLGDWPGLASGNLYQGRDLMATTDMRSLFKSLLHDHLGTDRAAIDAAVFPNSDEAPYITGLV